MASVVLAHLLAFPLARLFQSGSHSIAGPAIAHTSSNASFLILSNSDEIALLLAHTVVVLGSFYLWFWLDHGVVRRPEVA
jgi:hypothetical protein